MNYELSSLTELNQKNTKANICAEWMFSFVIMSANQKASGGEWPLATMTHICQLYGTAQQTSHS